MGTCLKETSQDFCVFYAICMSELFFDVFQMTLSRSVLPWFYFKSCCAEIDFDGNEVIALCCRRFHGSLWLID